ncbi:Accessory protein regulator protein A [Clostridium liquoris]|uniref:Stage 0 sporulation protein A homolog n=1 Tax=Clostridium liquoris TaxID=1289519 RepID=A0A2T0B1S4_9CLOT|nr:LytTR family DNA-binding domain-containing protein [Clostridium liquoris]PRR77432.1 Accessory protein regulator protein A [Clostridium liquoris]
MINIMICDDCLEIRNIITNVINDFYKEINFKEFNIVSFDNFHDSIDYVRKNNNEKNIYLLDIDLNEEKNGLILGQEIRELDNYLGEMIFITNYSHMGFKVFQYKLKVLDFIDKNYNFQKQLRESILIATKILSKKENGHAEKKLQIKVGSQIYNVLFKDIYYIETIKSSRKVVLYTSNSRLEFYDTLKNLSSLLDDRFIQIHRTIIVNKNYIENVCKDYNNPYVVLKDGVKCMISKDRLKEVMKNWM